MTPEERDRTIEFILNCQARYEARLEQEAEERKHEAEQRKHEAAQWREQRETLIRWTGEIKQFVARIVELVEIQSRRLDQHEKLFREIQNEEQRRHEESMARLDRILDRLSDPNRKN